jgi:hypothetical protein
MLRKPPLYVISPLLGVGVVQEYKDLLDGLTSKRMIGNVQL